MNQFINKPCSLITALLLFISFLPASAQQENDRSLLWQVTGQALKEPSYLFGTYHLLTDKFTATLPEINTPFTKAKGVVVEMVIDSSHLAAMGAMAIMPDKKISELMNPDEFALVSSEVEKVVGANMTALNQFKPVSIMVIMTMMYAQQKNAEILKKYAGTPMDYYFAVSGKKSGKVVTPLETQAEQAQLLYDAYPISEQARQLVEFVKQKDLAAKTQVDLVNLYLAKDLHGMYTLMEKMPQEFGNSDFLLKDRNLKWMKVLPDLMTNESQFIAVGALHLAGPDGLITLLRQRGYSVTPVTHK
ncbi:MAG: TraB/GumN family protein [Cyclobacteriaceae bacterium]|nr:TraB/GumN family protein [Cyclobacteriaceae bacterium]